MTIEEAQQLWNTQPEGTILSTTMIREIKQGSDALSRAVLYRDITEWAATLVLFATFFAAGLFPGAPTVWFFCAAFVALLPGCYLVVSRLKFPSRHTHQNNREFLEYTHHKYLRQERMLSGVIGWYLTPLFLSALLFIVGTVLNIPGFSWQLRLAVFAIQISVFLVIFSFVGLVNIRTARTRIRPKLRELERILNGFEDAAS